MRYLYVGLITGGCTLAAIGLWLSLFRRDRVSGVSTRQLLIVILAVGFLCRVAFAFLTPTFYAPDEQPHFMYVKYLVENRSFPVQTSDAYSPTNDWEYYQPPLYYLSLTPFYWLSQTLFQEAVTVRLLRVFSIMLWGITALLTIRFLDSLNLHDDFIRIFVVSMISLLPTYTFLSSVINNDNLLIAIGSGILYLAVQPKTSLKNSVLVGILLGLGLLTKLTAGVYIALIAFILLIGLVRRTTGRSTIPHIILAILLAALIWAPWAWRNWNVYGSITAEEVANVLIEEWKSIFQAAGVSLEGLQVSFWAVSGIHNNISFFYPAIGRHVFYLAMVGLLYGLLSKREKLASLARKDISIIIASALAILVNFVLVFRFGLLYGQAQGRFLFPLLAPLSVLMAIGLRMFSGSDAENSHIHLAGFFITYAVSFTSYSLTMFTRV